ncbi:MAG: polysaccharide pyruvyl transferase family protein [Pseudorhizobium sp.]
MANQSAASYTVQERIPQPLALADQMQALSRHTDDVANSIPKGARVGFVDYPVHINVGDLLILLGTMQFFKSNENSIPTSFCVFDENARLYDALDHTDLIVCHGGGNFGDIYPKHQRLRERIVECFPKKPVVIMPQSFHFSAIEAMKDSGAVFRGHDNVTIYVRDEASYQIARNYFSDQVHFCPDMAHRLYDKFAPVRAAALPDTGTKGPLQLMRRDAEASTGHQLTHDQGSMDWSDIMTTVAKSRIWRYRAAAKLDGAFARGNPGRLEQYSSTVSSIVSEIADRLVTHKEWTTSRLHGAIFGLLLGRDVTLFDNSYGKNSRYFSLWGETLVNLQSKSVQAE